MRRFSASITLKSLTPEAQLESLRRQLHEAMAQQSALADENVRLLNETKEALERQTAISEILRVISASPADVRPVLEVIAENALRFCAAGDVLVMFPDGDDIRLVAHRGQLPIASDLHYPNDGTSMNSFAFLQARTVAVPDLQTETRFPLGAENARAVGYHAVVAAPLLRDGVAVGTIALRRSDTRPFSEPEIGALEMFAAQAVVAIENARLFNESKESLERQTALAEILRAISRAPTDIQPVLDAIAESAARFCTAVDVSVGLIEAETWRIRAHHGPVESPDVEGGPVFATTQIGPTFVSGRSMIERRTIHVPDLQAEADEYPDDAAASATTRAILATPLLSAVGAIGAMSLSRTEATPFTEQQIELAETFAAQAVIAIENVRLREQEAEARARARVDQELHAAQLIQQQFLPKSVPDIPGWQIATFYRAATQVGGDFYDFIDLPDGKVGLVVGDVTGHGVPAALVMATTRSVLRSEAPRLVAPGAVLARVNNFLHADIPANMFVTCLYAVLDPKTGGLTYANAGHDLPFVRRGDQVEELRAAGMPLGAMPDMSYQEKEAVLNPGDVILLHSDGLAEAHDPSHAMFGFPRMRALMGELGIGHELIDGLLSSLHAFTGPAWEQEDDITLVVLTRSPGNSGEHVPAESTRRA